MGQEEKKESKKEKVIQAAIKLFSEQGYHDTAVSEIADQAEVAKGTVYWYFDSKEELFWGIIVSGIESINQKLEEIKENGESAVNKLEAVIRVYLNFFKEGKAIAKMMQQSSVNPNDYFYQEMHKLRLEAINKLVHIIKEGEANDEFKSGIEREELANLILGSIFGSYNPHVYQIEDIDSKVELLLNVILNGISPKT